MKRYKTPPNITADSFEHLSDRVFEHDAKQGTWSNDRGPLGSDNVITGFLDALLWGGHLQEVEEEQEITQRVWNVGGLWEDDKIILSEWHGRHPRISQREYDDMKMYLYEVANAPPVKKHLIKAVLELENSI